MTAIRKSEAQLVAESRHARHERENRESTERSLVRREPAEFGKVVGQIRREYRLETPDLQHSMRTDAGGDPAMSREAEAYLDAAITGDHSATDAGALRWSFRAALDRAPRDHRRLVSLVVMSGLSPVEAAIECGVPEGFAKEAAEMTVRKFWRQMSPIPLGVSS